MKQLFWVALVSYHYLPKVCDSRMLTGLLIADMLEPLWPAAAVSSNSQRIISPAPFHSPFLWVSWSLLTVLPTCWSSPAVL